MVFDHPTGEHEPRHHDSGVVAYKLDAAGKVAEAWFLANDQQGFDKFSATCCVTSAFIGVG